MKIINTENKRFQLITLILAMMLLNINNKIWYRYIAECETMIMEHPPLLAGWVVLNSCVLFMCAMHFNNYLYRITRNRPLLCAAGVFMVYTILQEFVYSLSLVMPTMVTVTLIFAYGIKQASLYFYMQNHKETTIKINMVVSDTPPAVKDVDVIDPILEEVANYMITRGGCYISAIQRNFEVGYNRAQRIMTQLERAKIITEYIEGEPRTLLVSNEAEVAECIAKLREELEK